MAPTGWGILGTGEVVTHLMLPALRADPRNRIVGFVSRDPARARRLAAKHGTGHWGDLASMLEDPRVDAVYIASEHDRHAQQAQLACAAGKHVLCEKPLATQMADAEAAVRGARQRGVVLAVCHPLRGVPTIESIRRAVSSGAIGQVVAARATYSLPIDFAHDDWHRRGPSAGVLFE